MARPSTNRTPTRAEVIEGFTTPAVLLFWAVYYFLIELLITTTTKPLDLLSPSKIKASAFSRFWLVISASPDPPPSPSELAGSAALIPPLLAQATGNVLEIGPGSGTQLQYLDPRKQGIEHYHLAEPAVGLHSSLRAHAKKAGLKEVEFSVHACGADPQLLLPELAKKGVIGEKAGLTEVFDSIVVFRVLCSVDTPAETAKALYTLLKPRGKLIVVEHVANPGATGPWGSRVARGLQTLYSWCGWSFWVGNCHLRRDVEGVLEKAGEWEVGRGTEGLRLSFWWSSLPYVSGVLVKAKN